MVDCIRPTTKCKYTVPIPVSYVPDSEYPDQTARLSSLLMLMTSTTKERRNGHFIPFSRECWRKRFGGDASYVKQAAIQSGLIDENDRYSTGMDGAKAFCKSIRLRDEHRTGEFRVYELQRKTRQQPKPQLDQSRLKQVGIDLTGHLLHYVLPADFQPTSIWEAFQVDRIRHHDFYATRCDYGRFHSNITGLRRNTRFQLTTLSEEALSFIDVKSAQPLIVGVMARDRVRRQSGIPICDTLFRDDIDSWVAKCEDGSIYEFVLQQIQKYPIAPYWVTPRKKSKRPFVVDVTTWKKSQAKKAFIACMFDRIPSMLANPVYPVIEQHFPTIARFMVEAKASKYQALAHACQRMESTIMIDGATQKFMAAFPYAKPTTVHDELVCPSRFEAEARQFILAEFKKYGVTPTIK